MRSKTLSFPEIMGHRGVRGQDVPENSVAAFLEAIKQGAGGIELDARICTTGEIVVFHDKTLEQLSNGKGRVKYTDFETLRGLHLKQQNIIYTVWQHHIPTLDEVLDAVQPHLLVNPNFLVNVEIKGKDSPQAIVDILRARLEGGKWQPHNFTISHFHHERLALVKAQLPEIPLGLLFAKMGRNEKKMFKAAMQQVHIWEAASVNLPIECYLKGDLAKKLKDEGLIPVAWTMDEKPPRDRSQNGDPPLDPYARAVVEQGISLITDYPREMIWEIGEAKRTLLSSQRLDFGR